MQVTNLMEEIGFGTLLQGWKQDSNQNEVRKSVFVHSKEKLHDKVHKEYHILLFNGGWFL